METYIALLRGINVGGKNKLSMPALKEAFEEIGFSDVKTYINSGNIIFSSKNQDKQALIQLCEELITEKFMLTIPVTVLVAKDLSDILKHTPDWWDIDKESIHYAIFVISPVRVEDVYEAVGEIKPEYEQIAHHGEVIFWSAPRKTFSKARWSKIASSSVNNHVTIRNANTVNKLIQLSQQDIV
ncbi:DUF1697 domain-containing protein [Enterococcus sp. BWR-S5]|uniref:DUF1697 domain-containing protein n=1 Tax=Enterococcus sp. BWR-S5 TaxID=2787714 RepID=UPI001924AFDC|nr:DUF1697 domain-containing protein [Enterococcus sp. BWR-S5]MBL1224527.1 DUF1697 domain-containing protein [Enterococcus sp. BWR-S5]